MALLAALAAGCSTSAAIERRTGPTLVGRIDSSDGSRLYLTTDQDQRYAIERADVVSIDHPGKIGMVVGAVPTGVGLGFLAMAPFLHGPCNSPEQAPCWDLRALAVFAGLTYLVIGVPIVIGNLTVYSRSRSAATAPRSLEPIPAKWQSP